MKNLLLAIVLSMGVLFLYQYFFGAPPEETIPADQQRQAPDDLTLNDQTLTSGEILNPPGDETPGSLASPDKPTTAPVITVKPVLIDTGRVSGSISPVGVKFDNLVFKDYKDKVGKGAKNVVFLKPAGDENSYFANFGWRANPEVELPDDNTVWQADRERLTLETPLAFIWTSSQGVTFRQTVSIDENYLFTIRQEVQNNSQNRINVAPKGQITRLDTPATLGFFILHEGPIGYMAGELYDRQDDLTYKDLKEIYEDNQAPAERRFEVTASDGWLGFTDKYWASAIIPDQGETFKARFYYSSENNRDRYVSSYFAENGTVLARGESLETLTYFFAGPKEVDLIDAYEEDFGIPKFDLLIDWGWFYFLTKPIFYALDFITKYVGNVGVAILILTVFIKLLMFPMANKSFRSMSRQKKLQPKIKQLRERFGDDKLKLQQETMALYKKEKANPAAGCLPMLVQIPVFFALYKVLFVTLEMRHKPFFGWVQDLSAPDPLTFITGFGQFPWDAPEFLMIGVWPILMGISMWVQMKMNPQSPDPIQAKIFMFMPIFFTFILARFPVGLVIYWTWNNLLTMAQQWVIMKREGVFEKKNG